MVHAELGMLVNPGVCQLQQSDTSHSSNCCFDPANDARNMFGSEGETWNRHDRQTKHLLYNNRY